MYGYNDDNMTPLVRVLNEQNFLLPLKFHTFTTLTLHCLQTAW